MRILVVKGANPLSQELRRGINEPNFEIDLVSCPEEAEALAQKGQYDTIILDLKIVLAGRGEQGREIDDGKLVRPAEVESLLERLQPLVGQRMKRSAAVVLSPKEVLRAYDLELIPTARVATRGGKPLDLTNREYEVLELLARNKGKLVTHGTLLSAVWGDKQQMHPSILGTYIRRLREKVDKGHEIELVLTRWGRGYMLRGDG